VKVSFADASGLERKTISLKRQRRKGESFLR
jgi:hypothetical protein